MKLYIVGTGPGSIKQMTEAALNAIRESEVIVGYDKYIELIKEEIKGKEIYTIASKVPPTILYQYQTIN